MKLAKQWIKEHSQDGDYPLVDVPIGCFTEAQIREIQWDMVFADPSECRKLFADVIQDGVYSKKALEETK